VLAALSSTTKTIEFVIIAVVVLLLILTIVLYARKNAQMKKANDAAMAPSSYFAEQPAGAPAPVAAPPAQTFAAAQPDPFAGFAPAAQAPQPAYAAPAAQQQAPAYQGPAAAPAPAPAPPAPPAAPVGPLPGTPAGWLPDPSGAPDTLRYWDGNAWTQHVAQRG
jgi:hypothetical protein